MYHPMHSLLPRWLGRYPTTHTVRMEARGACLPTLCPCDSKGEKKYYRYMQTLRQLLGLRNMYKSEEEEKEIHI